MARTHGRSSSPEHVDPLSQSKKPKTSHHDPGVPTTSTHTIPAEPVLPRLTEPAACFAPGIFDHNHIARLHASYVSNQPFKYALVEKLFQDDLLQKVKDECVIELNFAEKETDIYKVNQTGDLASLNFLSSSQIAVLTNLLTLRNALYSSTFRAFLQAVTGCGPLSGKKQDMSVNSYTKGCHLLNHDDVIGTRRVSYILYMPLPHYQLWQKSWGGALELYPVEDGSDGQPQPKPMPSKSIPPSWNQFIFFEVQPGKSFHSVEEVVVGGEGEDGRERLSISGWFHAAQEDEEGYILDAPAPEVKSSREQLTSSSTTFKDYPIPSGSAPDLSLTALSEEHLSFLSEFLNPVYLQPRTMQTLATRFAEESSLELHHFLCNPLADALEPRLRDVDVKDSLGPSRPERLPPHTAGADNNSSWTIKGPPHKWRYCILKEKGVSRTAAAVTPRAAHGSSDLIMRSLQDELFPSAAFRAWVAIVSRLMPLRYSSEARRFRPGLDYTLATSEDHEARLDAVLGLTPMVNGDGSSVSGYRHRESEVRGWLVAEWGGWECYMAPHNEEDDPAVYRSSMHKKPKPNTSETTDHPMDTSISPRSHVSLETDAMQEDPGEGEAMESDQEEEDGTLLTVQPGFNRLLLVLRDERVMRFVKYVSAAAEGSRWDICAEYEVGMVQEDDENLDANS